MRALLTPYIQHGLGVVLLKPGGDLLSLFENTRVVVSSVPEQFKGLPSGVLPFNGQIIGNDERLTPFFSHQRVIDAAGSFGLFTDWLKQNKRECQFGAGSDYCHTELTITPSSPGAVSLCWYHDSAMGDQITERLNRAGFENLAEWVLNRIIIELRLPFDHQLSLPELGWWAVLNQVFDLVPETIAATLLNRPISSVIGGPVKSADIKPFDDRATVAIKDKIQQANINLRTDAVPVKQKLVKKVTIDAESPASFMLRPKMATWECKKYTQWVKKQPCVCCGSQSDDPHHIINVGMGGKTAGKVHDLFVIPLCRIHHDELHHDVARWEAEHGLQIDWVIRTIDRALGLRVII